MKKGFFGKMLVLAVLILAMSAAAGCGASEGQVKKDVREKLLLAYQYLENMEFDAALDAFAAVIEIDEKQVDAYIGMARAYSARGDHATARETARKGYEATGNTQLETLDLMYERISEKEDKLKELADLIRRSGDGIPGELEEQESHLFSDLLEELWKDLDSEETWAVYDGTDYVIVYPTDPEKGEYLLVYPDGHYYLGSIEFTPYSELLALLGEEEGTDEPAETEEGKEAEEIDREPLIVPEMEGRGILAGVSERNGLADLYMGLWKDGCADGEGIFVFQKLPDGERYVYYGTFSKGAYQDYTALYGSSEAFLMRALGEEVSEEDLLAGFNDGLVSLKGKSEMMTPAVHGENRYAGIFANMDLFRLLDQGEKDRVLQELTMLRNNARSPFAIDGRLLYLGTGWGVYDWDKEHDLYVISPNAKDGHESYLNEEKGRQADREAMIYYVTDRYGRILDRHAGPTWFTDSGYRAVSFKDPSTGEEYWGSLDNEMIDADRYDIWQTDYDWEGNETGTGRYGEMSRIYEIYSAANQTDIRRPWENGHAGSDAEVTLEKSGEDYLVKDAQGNQIGSLKGAAKSYMEWAVNGNMICIFDMELWYGSLYCVTDL